MRERVKNSYDFIWSFNSFIRTNYYLFGHLKVIRSVHFYPTLLIFSVFHSSPCFLLLFHSLIVLNLFARLFHYFFGGCFFFWFLLFCFLEFISMFQFKMTSITALHLYNCRIFDKRMPLRLQPMVLAMNASQKCFIYTFFFLFILFLILIPFHLIVGILQFRDTTISTEETREQATTGKKRIL